MPRDVSSSSSSSSSSSEDEESKTAADPKPAEIRGSRFQCPADFVPFSHKACSSTVKTSSSELWLIKAPAGFDPQSFSGVQLPLCGLQTLRVPSAEGAEHVYTVLGSSRRSPEPRLLTSPKNAPQRASLASPFAGLISICQSYGEHGTDPALHVVPAVPAPSLPPGLKQRFQHTAFKSATPAAEGEARRKRRRERRIKTEPEEERERAEPEELRSHIKTEVKPEPLDPQYEEQAVRRKKKKKKSKSDD